MSTLDYIMVAIGVVSALAASGALIVGIISLNKAQTVDVRQPVAITVTEELHQKFASKEAFEQLVNVNSERHADLYNKIDEAKDIARTDLSEEMKNLNAERQKTMEKLNDQFTFIRESLAAINREISLKRRQAGPGLNE